MKRSGSSGKDIRADRPHVEVVDVAGRDLPPLVQAVGLEGKTLSIGISNPSHSGARPRPRGVVVRPARRSRWLAARTDSLIHGATVPREHSARLSALRRGVTQLTPTGWLQRAIQGQESVVAVGDRDASTAAAMIGWILFQSDRDPTVWLRQASPQLGGWARLGQGPHAVVEWPEHPTTIPTCGVSLVLLAGGDDSAAAFLATRGIPVITIPRPAEGSGDSQVSSNWEYRINCENGGDWAGSDIRLSSSSVRFRTFHQGRFACEVTLARPIVRQVPCALAAMAACDRLGVPVREIREGLAEFAGLSRDFDERGSYRGVTLVDDTADEPDAVAQVVALARRVYGRRRLWAVVASPGSLATAGSACYSEALLDVDRVVVMPGPAGPSSAGAPGSGRSDGPESLALGLASRGRPVCRVDNPTEAIAELDRHLEPGDVVLTLGAGDVGTIADAFLRRLSRDRPGG